MNQRHGFILIIVLVLLGILAFLAVSFVQISQESRALSTRYVDKCRSRLMARSGVEMALSRITDNPMVSGSWSRHIGDGTKAPYGDATTVSVQCANGMINLNDGLEAAELERGDQAANNALTLYEETEVLPGSAGNPALFTASMIYRNYILTSSQPIVDQIMSEVRPGDIFSVRDASGVEVDRGEIIDFGKVWINVLRTVVFIEGQRNKTQLGPFTVRVLRRKPLGILNLRLRHLLNAYGDVHRFVAQQGWPVWKRAEFEGGTQGNYGTPFVPTSTGLEGLDDPCKGRDSLGAMLDDPAVTSTGLGDRLIALRPLGGWKDVDSTLPVILDWAEEFMPSGTAGGLMERVTLDFTVASDTETAFPRIKREFGWRRQPNSTDTKMDNKAYYTVSANLDSTITPNMVLMRSLSRGHFDMRELFTRHPHHPIALPQASASVQAALFWACTNVGYLAESSRAAYDTSPPYNASSPATEKYAANIERFVGVAEPVFTQPEIENGSVAVAPIPAYKRQRGKFMSLRDALVTTQACGDYLTRVGSLRTWDDFREFLEWRESEAADYEKVQPRTAAFNADRVNGGQFMQDYAAFTLPQALGSLVRVPGWLGAPHALLSPYRQLEPFNWTTLPGGGASLPDKVRFHEGMHPVLRAEDFVMRFTLPRVTMTPMGRVRVLSHGRIADATRTVAATQIDAVFEAFRKKTFHSQKDFAEATDPAGTDDSILMGPDFNLSPDYPNPHMGVVGLRDVSDPPSAVSGTVVLNHNFDGSINPEPPGELPTDPTQDTALDWMESNLFYYGIDGGGVFPRSHESGLEGADAPFLGEGSKGCDLSPFNGVRLLSLNHGLNHRTPIKQNGSFPLGAFDFSEPLWALRDSLYWRPADPFSSSPMLDPTLPTGAAAGLGSMTLWFRIPSSDDMIGWVSDWMPPPAFASPSISRCSGPFHMLACLNLWEQAEDWWNAPGSVLFGYPVEPGRPVNLQLGYLRDSTTGKGRLIGRYESRGRWMEYSSPDWYQIYEMPCPFGFYKPGAGFADVQGWPTNLSSYASSNDFLGLSHPAAVPIPPATAHDYYRTHNQTLVGVTEVVLKDLPETGPGTWHRVTLQWDCSEFAATPLKVILHDASNKESEIATTIHDGSGAEPNPTNMFTFDSAMTLSLGEAQARCRMRDGQFSYFKPSLTFNGDYENAAVSSRTARYLPAWRLDSCLDNFRLYLKTQGDSNPVAVRHDVSTHPAWTLSPSKVIPADAKIRWVGARIFEPIDSADNYPGVELECQNAGVDVSPLADHTLDRALGRTTERFLEFPSLRSSDVRLRLKYYDHNPQGQPLVNDATDNWTEIPWIVQVWMAYSLGTPKMISWKVN